MFRLVLLVICFATLTGCNFFLAFIEERFGSFEAFVTQAFTGWTPEDLEYISQLSDSGGGLYNLPGGSIDVDDALLDIHVLVVPKPEHRFNSWKEGPNLLFPNRTDTLLNIKTTGLTSSAWLDFFRESTDDFGIAPSFSRRSANEIASEPLDWCIGYSLFTPGSVTTTTTSLETGGRTLTLESSEQVTSFAQTGPHHARLEIQGTNRILDEAFNQIAVERATQRLGVVWPNAGADKAGVTLYYELADIETVVGDRQITILRVPQGLPVYPAGLSLNRRKIEYTVRGTFYQGESEPKSADDFRPITFNGTITHGRMREHLVLIGPDGPINAKNCRFNIDQTINVGGLVSNQQEERVMLATDTLSYKLLTREAVAGGEERSVVKSFEYTAADGQSMVYMYDP